MANKRDISLDYAKGFAILLIVIFHLYGYTGRHDNSFVYSFCQNVQIVIFIFVSGMLVGKSNKAIKIGSKATRLIVPFVSFYFIWGIIDYHNFALFFLDEFKFGYWFVLVLFEIMLLYVILSRLASKLKLPSIIIHLLFFALLSLYEWFLPRNNMFNILFCINLLWHYYPFFVLGSYSSRLNEMMVLKYAPLYCLLFVISQYFYFTQSIRLLAPICNLSSLLLFMSLFQNRILPFKKIVAKFGEFSMQIYLLHFVLLSLIFGLIPIQENCWIEFCFYMVLAIFIIFIIISVSQIIMKNKLASLLLFGIGTIKITCKRLDK